MPGDDPRSAMEKEGVGVVIFRARRGVAEIGAINEPRLRVAIDAKKPSAADDTQVLAGV